MGIGINNDFSEVIPGLHADIKLQTAHNKMRCLPAADHHLKKCHSYRVKAMTILQEGFVASNWPPQNLAFLELSRLVLTIPTKNKWLIKCHKRKSYKRERVKITDEGEIHEKHKGDVTFGPFLFY